MIARATSETAHLGNGVAELCPDDTFVLPATIGQQGFWYLDQVQPGNPAYNIAVRFRLQGSLRSDNLERALQEIVRRHESLRTVFSAIDGVPMQVVAPRLSVPLQRDDLWGGSEHERNRRAQLIATEEGRAPFDLAHGPLIRTKLLRLRDDEHILLVTVHHIVSDGWSIGVLTQELGVLYDAYCRGLDSPLPELPLQYGDFAIWQEKWLQSRGVDNQIRYWAKQLANLSTLEVPADHPRPPAQTFHGSIESLLLPKELTDRLVALSNQEKATLFILMLAAFKQLLQRCTGQNDIFVGSVFAGRPRVEIEPLFGLFINPLVLRTDLSGNPPFRELLVRVRDTVLQAFANQDIPFERVVEVIQARREPGRPPVFQINFLFQRDFVQPFQASGLTMTAIPSVSPGSIYDLNFFLVERAEGWRASCEYNTDLYQASTIRGLLERFHNLLKGIAANPGSRISEFELTSNSEPGPSTIVANQLPQPIVADSEPAEGAPDAYVAPRDPAETRLAEIWERLLGKGRISVAADFFDVGGHSLLAGRLLAQVEKAFGKKLPLAALLQAPTIESLAVRLREERSTQLSGRDPKQSGQADRLDGAWVDPDEQVFPIRREGTRPPLILVDAGPFHRLLVRSLGADQPVFGVALPEMSALPRQFTANDLAANLVDALCKSAITGPYYLAGWSMAGVIAYEMARQLLARGKTVALVLLLDSNNPTYFRSFQGWSRFPIRLYFWIEKVIYHLGRLRKMPIKKAWRYFWERRRKFEMRSFGNSQPSEARPRESAATVPDSWKAQYAAAAAYHPQPAQWPLVLIRSQALQTGWFRDAQLGWGEVTDRAVEVHEMPGEHDAMFLEPDVRRLASVVADCLRRADR